MIAPKRLLSAFRGESRHARVGPIGFELGVEMLHMLQLERHGPEARIRAAISKAYPGGRESVLGSPREFRALVRKGLDDAPFRGRRIVTALPSSETKLMVLNYNLGSGQTEPELVLRLVQERIEEPIGECVVDYRSIRTSEHDFGAKSALVAAASREAVIRHLEMLRTAGLEAEALEITPVAVHRLIILGGNEGDPENALVINCNAQRSDLTAIWGRRLLLYREVEFGANALIEQLGKSLDLEPESAASLLKRYGVHPGEVGAAPSEDPARALEITQTVAEILKPSFSSLAEQVQKAAVYTASQSRGASIDQVYLLGYLARWPGAGRLLESLLSIPVRIPDPLSAFPMRSDSAALEDGDSDAGIAIATGFALRGFHDEQ